MKSELVYVSFTEASFFFCMNPLATSRLMLAETRPRRNRQCYTCQRNLSCILHAYFMMSCYQFGCISKGSSFNSLKVCGYVSKSLTYILTPQELGKYINKYRRVLWIKISFRCNVKSCASWCLKFEYVWYWVYKLYENNRTTKNTKRHGDVPAIQGFIPQGPKRRNVRISHQHAPIDFPLKVL